MHIVALGASAGGLEALWEFFDHLPTQTDAAFVVIMHLQRHHKSVSDQLLAKHTSLPICWASQGQSLLANTIYFLPPNRLMTLEQGCLCLTTRREEDRHNQAIDHFFISLALNQQQEAIGIILSGMGSDGAKGCVVIHQQGGRVMVQEPRSALFDAMPRAAIENAEPDFILPPAQLAQALVTLLSSPMR